MQVLKFGGTSVANAENINKVVAIVKEISKKRYNQLLSFQHWVVVTDLLLECRCAGSRRK